MCRRLFKHFQCAVVYAVYRVHARTVRRRNRDLHHRPCLLGLRRKHLLDHHQCERMHRVQGNAAQVSAFRVRAGPQTIANVRPGEGDTFSTTTNADACTPHTNCMPGQSVVYDPTTSRDRTCASCAPMQFSATTNAVRCTAWSDCPAGQYVSTLPTAASDRVCAACADGTYSPSSNRQGMHRMDRLCCG